MLTVRCFFQKYAYVPQGSWIDSITMLSPRTMITQNSVNGGTALQWVAPEVGRRNIVQF